MMTVPMDNTSAPSSREIAERLYNKNIELENRLRKSAQSRVPSNPNIWSQMRENYEAIILEDHDFSEKHDVEFALWQLHYRKIEEFRANINAAKSAGSGTAQGGRSPARPDHIKKIRSVFKSFLSESTGFYHDLILKIRVKFGLPLSFFSDGSESQTTLIKDEKKLAETKKGLMSCHRCLIYLGDFARYKGLYGEGDSVNRDFTAASSYYIQAVSLCPSSGNPHHQLAILASYSGDDLVAIYRYFRSLAVDNPFLTARDNLIIAFEKNRQSFSQLPGNTKTTPNKTSATRSTGRGRGRGDSRIFTKDIKMEAPTMQQQQQDLNIPEIFKAFSTRFVRLNGILFTRTSLETFGEIFASVISDLLDLLSSGPEEELNFGPDAAENGLIVVRLIAILIFTVHNVNRESEGQSYAEILQRTVLLQNAFTGAFMFAGHIIKRCIQLHDSVSSYLLPAILVFIEWLACHPDVAAGFDVEEQQASARSFFWHQCVTFMNKLILSGIVSVNGDEDESCFFDMSRYDDGETGNRLALWEDFELRGFLPLVPAQLILDFSRKHSFGLDGNSKEKGARAQRILAAVRALMNVVQVDRQRIYFDACFTKFMISAEAPAIEDNVCIGSDTPESNIDNQVIAGDRAANFEASKFSEVNLGVTQSKGQLYVDGGEEDEEEEIVFKPTVSEKYQGVVVHVSSGYETAQHVQASREGDWPSYSTPLSASLNKLPMPTILHTSSVQHVAAPNFSQQPLQQMNANTLNWLMDSQQSLQNVNANTSKWLMEQGAFLSDGLKDVNIDGNGLLSSHRMLEGLSSLQPTVVSHISAPPSVNVTNQMKVIEAVIPSTFDSIIPAGNTSDGLGMKHSSGLQTTSRKLPVSRPVRHFGPPPGFSHAPSKQLNDYVLDSAINEQNPQVDDYSWLDGYQPSTKKGAGMENTINHTADMYSRVTNDNTSMLNGVMSFPFPGKQISAVQTQAVDEKKWQDFQLFEQPKPYSEQQLQQANFQPSVMPDQHQAQSLWSGRYFV